MNGPRARVRARRRARPGSADVGSESLASRHFFRDGIYNVCRSQPPDPSRFEFQVGISNGTVSHSESEPAAGRTRIVHSPPHRLRLGRPSLLREGRPSFLRVETSSQVT